MKTDVGKYENTAVAEVECRVPALFEVVASGRPYSVRRQEDGTYLVEYLEAKDSTPSYGPRGIMIDELVLRTTARTREEIGAELDEKITQMEAGRNQGKEGSSGS